MHVQQRTAGAEQESSVVCDSPQPVSHLIQDQTPKAASDRPTEPCCPRVPCRARPRSGKPRACSARPTGFYETVAQRTTCKKVRSAGRRGSRRRGRQGQTPPQPSLHGRRPARRLLLTLIELYMFALRPDDVCASVHAASQPARLPPVLCNQQPCADALSRYCTTISSRCLIVLAAGDGPRRLCQGRPPH